MAGPAEVIELAPPLGEVGPLDAGLTPVAADIEVSDVGPPAAIGFDSPLGWMVIEADGLGLRALRWGEGAVPGGGAMNEGAALLVEARDQVRAYFEGRLRRFTLPLAPRGTRFQRAVWGFINDIPFGFTLTYGELAALVGSGPRAVARACGANPLPLIIPCHRIVGANPGAGGYSAPGGLETKRFLLGLEGAGQRPGRLGLVPRTRLRAAAQPSLEF